MSTVFELTSCIMPYVKGKLLKSFIMRILNSQHKYFYLISQFCYFLKTIRMKYTISKDLNNLQYTSNVILITSNRDKWM